MVDVVVPIPCCPVTQLYTGWAVRAATAVLWSVHPFKVFNFMKGKLERWKQKVGPNE